MLVASTLMLAGCGGSADDEARRLQTRSVIATNDPVQRYLVSRAAIEKAPRGSVQRAFLQYWSDLQFQAYDAASFAYEPGLRRLIGDDVLIRALASQGASYRSSRPDIVSSTTNGDRAQVRYFRIGAQDTTPTSSSWTRDGTGRWLITYNPPLDQALADIRQLETQQAIDPLAQKSLPAAIRAGSRARKIQSEYAAQRRRSGSAGR